MWPMNKNTQRLRRRYSLRAVCLLIGWLVASSNSGHAYADAVPSPEDNCPAGSQGDTCHGGLFCSPNRCTDDSQCKDGQTCQQLQLCIGKIDCTGGWDPGDAGPYYYDTVEASCAGDVPCAVGSCLSLKACAAVQSPPSTSNETIVVEQCGCRIGQRISIAPWWCGVLMLFILRLRGRRSGVSRRSHSSGR